MPPPLACRRVDSAASSASSIASSSETQQQERLIRSEGPGATSQHEAKPRPKAASKGAGKARLPSVSLRLHGAPDFATERAWEAAHGLAPPPATRSAEPPATAPRAAEPAATAARQPRV